MNTTKELYDDSQELADVLRELAPDHFDKEGLRYYMHESACHIESLYRHALNLEAKIVKLGGKK